jgi:hypothetical protein
MRTNLAVFIIFFGMALLDAVRGGAWWTVLLWLAVGAVFFWADYRRPATRAH